MNIIPQLHHCEIGKDKCLIPEVIAVDVGDFSAISLDVFQNRIQRPLIEGSFLQLHRNTELDEEGYKISIEPARIVIESSSDSGVIFALTTLSFLMVDTSMPCLKISDQPKYPYRGLSVDCARHFYPVDEIKKVIDTISLVKMNKFHWHLTDDQGWRIESNKFPLLHQTSKTYYTQEQIREIVHYAKCRGVEVVPEIDMPGHVSALLAAYPEYSCSNDKITLPKTSGIFPHILCAGQDKTYVFIEMLLDEIMPLFESDKVHIGGDEVPKTEWKKCSHCQKKMAEFGYQDYQDLQGYFTAKVIDILKKHGKKPIVWNESLLGTNPPQDMIVQYWTPVHSQAMKMFIHQGGQWIYSDMFDLYLDYPHSMTSLKKVFNTKPHIGFKKMGLTQGLMGLECCLWSERISSNETLERLLFPRVIALADIAWHGSSSYSNFEKRLMNLASSRLFKDICFTNPAYWNMTGRERKNEALSYFQSMFDSMDEDAKRHTNDYAKPSAMFAFLFIRKFFRFSDIPDLLKVMKKHQ